MKAAWGRYVPLFVAIPLLLPAQTMQLIPGPQRTFSRPVQRFSISSQILKETRQVSVALPPSYFQSDASVRYPVVIVFDGETMLPVVTAAADQLSRQGQIPEVVLAAIENLDAHRLRVRDLTPPGLSVSGSSRQEGGDRFLDFVEQELLPSLDRQFRTALPRVVIGHSSAGILAVYAAATRPAFRAVVALDAPVALEDNWLVRKLIANVNKSAPPLHLAAFSARFDWPADLWTRLRHSAPKGWQLHYEKLPHETHASIPALGTYLGLREVFLAYSHISAPEFPTTSILPYYDKLTSVFGGSLTPPESLMRDVIESLVMEGRGREARSAYNRLVQSYGKPSDAAQRMDEIAELEKLPPPPETVESLLQNPFPAAEQASLILGDWKGETWMGEGERRKVTLRIRMEDGKVTGQWIIHTDSGDHFQKLDYLKLDTDGFTYGFMNGIRPRGMILWTVHRQGSQYRGQMRWGGIRVRMPGGMEEPPRYVLLRKSSAITR